jgi:hypothetical protein
MIPLKEQTISYAVFHERMESDADYLPLFRWEATQVLAWYVPAWAPAHAIERLTASVSACTIRTIAICRVTGIPQDRLFGEWADHLPSEEQPHGD